MSALNFITLFAVFVLAQTGWADPLDTWTWRNPLPTGDALNSVAYGSGLFVAVGDAATIVTSAEGVNWTLRREGGDNVLSGIAYGNGQFVAAGGAIVAL
jgi:hypothetical protein